MSAPISIRKMITVILKESNKALGMSELISEIEVRFNLSKNKQQIRGALNAYDCRNIVRVGKETYDLLSRVINGIYFRVTLTDTDIERGSLNCDDELQFIFNSVYRYDNQLVTLKSEADSISLGITFCGADARPRRTIEGLNPWFKQWNLCSGDDIIIKVIDYDASIYEIAPQKKEFRDEALISRKNKEVADILENISKRIDIKGGSLDLLTARVVYEYSYKDKCPPDTISNVIKNDVRFECCYDSVLVGIYLKDSPIFTGQLMRANNVRPVKHRKIESIFQFKISLEGIRPSIWRTIQVPSYYSFWDLHIAIQDAIGWFDCHLHEFRIKRTASKEEAFIGIPDEDSDFDLDRETLAGWDEYIKDWFSIKNRTAKYIYDFGDDWNHTIKLEEIITCEENIPYPRCIAGEYACPPEDVGGIYGYHNFLEIIYNLHHPEHKEMLQWAGGSFDPKRFDFQKIKFDDPDERFKIAFQELER